MVTSRENVINGGYKTANTRPISVSFSPFPSPSRLMNPPPLPSLPSFPTRSLPQNAEFIFLDGSSSIPSQDWTLGRDLESLLNEQPNPSKCANSPRGWGNFLTAEKSHPPRGWFVLWNPSWDLCSNRGASLVKGINSKVEGEMWVRMKRRQGMGFHEFLFFNSTFKWHFKEAVKGILMTIAMKKR